MDFKRKVCYLIDQRWITFEDPFNSLNMSINPFPNHIMHMLTFDNYKYDK